MALQPTEITFRALILAILLAIILAAANAYLGLKVGLTVSASIPAAILSMGILRFFKNPSILENNLVQTGASAGEALIAGTTFILPALIILRYWQHFNYWQTAIISLSGGIIGVVFSIPLRRILLADDSLRFPEGTAIGQVLKISREASGNFKELIQGSLLGAGITLFQTGFQIIGNNLALWFKLKDKFIYGLSCGFEPALLAAGYIVGFNVARSTLLGVVIGWVIGIPILSNLHPSYVHHYPPQALATVIWQSSIRPIGVGTMLIGGLWTMALLIKPIVKGVHSSFVSLKTIKESGYSSLPTHERDIPIHYTFALLIVLIAPLSYILFDFISHPGLGLPSTLKLATLIICTLFILVTGFFFSSLCGYFAGLIGSSQSPISGVSISALLLTSLLLLVIFSFAPKFSYDSKHLLEGEGLAIIIGTLISSSCAITNDTIQDLKTGQIVGATPWKQQVILIIGVIVSALVLAPTLELLFNAYGIAGIAPPGRSINPSQMLSAPQATLMANLVTGAFKRNLPWGLISIGFIIALVCILSDRMLSHRNIRLPVLAVGLGIYLPLNTSSGLILGGFASYLIEKTLSQLPLKPSKVKEARQRGLTLACGLVAGACLMGVILAVPFTLAQSTEILRLMPLPFTWLSKVFGLLCTLSLLGWLYYTVCHRVK